MTMLRHRGRPAALAALLLAVALLAAACGGGGGGQSGGQSGAPAPADGDQGAEPGQEQGPIVVGFINHLSGDAAVYGTSMQMGTQVALAEINEAGGIGGRPLEVIYEDDRLDANQAIAAAQKLINQDGVKVIMGSGSSSLSLALAPVVDEAGVLLISSISTNPALADFENVMLVMPSDSAQGAAWAAVARDWGVAEAAVLYINNDYGIGVKDIFTREFEAQGGRILASEGFQVGSTDLRTQLLRIRDSGARHVFMVSHVVEGVLALRQGQELGLDVTWVLDIAMQTQEVIDLAGEAAEGVYALQVGRKDHDTYARFVEAFQAVHGQAPTIWSDFAYDTTRLVAAAIEAVGNGPEAIKQWLLQVEDFPGATGPIRFGEDGFRSAEGSYQLYRVVDGQWQPVDG